MAHNLGSKIRRKFLNARRPVVGYPPFLPSFLPYTHALDHPYNGDVPLKINGSTLLTMILSKEPQGRRVEWISSSEQ